VAPPAESQAASVAEMPPAPSAVAAPPAQAEPQVPQEVLQEALQQVLHEAAAVPPPPRQLEPVAKLEAEVAKLVQETFAREAFAPSPQPHEPAAQEIPADPEMAQEAVPEEMPALDMPPEPVLRAEAPPVGYAAPSSQPEPPRQMPDAVATRMPMPQPAAVPREREIRSAEPRSAGGSARPEARPRDPGAILSSETDLAVARAFNSLSRTVLSDNARTLEDLVTEMLRPLLKAWLDDNLPPLVERLVRMEIERVARGRPD
jgi:cell pole-organizing protein PopZ